MLGGDFNDIRDHEEKRGGSRRHKGRFQRLIAEMDMGEVKFRGDPFTWVNNRDGEDFIQERLDRFLGST